MASKAVPQLNNKSRLDLGALRPTDQQTGKAEGGKVPTIAAPQPSTAKIEKSGRSNGQTAEA